MSNCFAIGHNRWCEGNYYFTDREVIEVLKSKLDPTKHNCFETNCITTFFNEKLAIQIVIPSDSYKKIIVYTSVLNHPVVNRIKSIVTDLNCRFLVMQEKRSFFTDHFLFLIEKNKMKNLYTFAK